VAIIYRSAGMAAATAASQIAAANKVEVRVYQCDVSDEAAVEATFDTVVEDFGKLDILVANAGICHTVAAEDCTSHQFTSTMGVNFDGPWYCARSAAKHFRRQGGGGKGNIIFTTSISASIVNIPDKQAIVS
jgi:NAD(P)-dependent dehydrogenase (short-subunit alcohol dehydrogenase family)